MLKLHYNVVFLTKTGTTLSHFCTTEGESETWFPLVQINQIMPSNISVLNAPNPRQRRGLTNMLSICI